MQDDNTNRNDPLEPKDDLFNPNVDEERLENDFDPPAALPDDVDEEGIDDTFPETDTNIDAHEAYDEGLAGASEVHLRPEKDPDILPPNQQL